MCLEHLAEAVAGCVSSQGSESNSGCFSGIIPFSVVPSEVIGATNDFYSQTPSHGMPCPSLESEITAVVYPQHLETAQEAPYPLYPTQEVLPRLLLVARSWEMAVIKHVQALSRVFGSGSSRVDVFPGE